MARGRRLLYIHRIHLPTLRSKTSGDKVAEFYSATIRKADRFRGPVLLRDLHIVVQVEKLCGPSTAFPVIEQQDRICPAGIPWSSRWRRIQTSSSIRSAQERKPGRIMGIAGSFQAQPSSHQIRLPQESEYTIFFKSPMLSTM